MTSLCLDWKEVRHATCTTDRPTGGNTGRLFLTFGGPVCADRISYCPLDRVLTYKNLIYLLNLQFSSIEEKKKRTERTKNKTKKRTKKKSSSLLIKFTIFINRRKEEKKRKNKKQNKKKKNKRNHHMLNRSPQTGPPNVRKRCPVFPPAGQSSHCALARWCIVLHSCLDNLAS